MIRNKKEPVHVTSCSLNPKSILCRLRDRETTVHRSSLALTEAGQERSRVGRLSPSTEKTLGLDTGSR